MSALKALKRKFAKMKLRMANRDTSNEKGLLVPPVRMKPTVKKRVMQTVPISLTHATVPATSTAVPIVAPPHKTKPKQELRGTDGRPIIWVDLEGNKIAVRWSSEIEGLTHVLTYNEESANTLFGRMDELKAQGAMKKLIPRNFDNACKLLHLLNGANTLGIAGKRIWKIEVTDEFCAWYDAEHESNQVSEDAHKHLIYDEETVQREYDFLKVKLYPWQGPGFQFLNAVTKQGRGAFLCDETGLGKTFMIGAHLASMGYKAVVVCPAGLRMAWKRKLEEGTNLTCFVVDSKYPLNAQKYDVIIVSYAMLKKRGCYPLGEWVENQNRVLIMDEGQAAKNYDSNRTQYCLILSRYARHTIVVTATPLKNRIADLHPLLRITRRLWTEDSFEAFCKIYSTPERQVEIAEKLSKFMVRRMADEVWKNAPKLEVGQAWLELSNRDDYAQAEADFIQWLMSKGTDPDRLEAAERGHALVKLNKLRQLSAEGKVEAAAKLVAQTMDHNEQVVVFCAFNEPLYALASHFANKSGKNFKGQEFHGSAVIVGATPEAVRQDIIAKFMAGKIGLLCIGSNAGGVGIDLPIARFGYTLDLPWSPADFEQCTGRIKRIGQERDCQFIKFLATATIDQRMEAIINEKAHTFKRAVGDEGIVERVMGREVAEMQDSIVTSLLRSYAGRAA